MRELRNRVAAFLRCDSGRSYVEYGVAAALVAFACLAGIRFLGNATNNQNNATSDFVKNAGS
jgi:Flp pilus assembly pilin Flp